MIRNPFHPRKVIFWCIIPFLFLTLIPASRGTVSSIPPVDWVVSPGAILNYHFVVSENNSQGSLIDDLAQEYHYLDLDENLIGGPELEVNITDVNPLADVSLVVSNILNFSSGQLAVSQKIENEWDLAPKNLIFPFFVPINQWEAMTAEFTAQLPGSANITFNSSWVGENSYLLSWDEDDPESEGSIRFDLQMVWEDEDGILQWLDLDIEDASGNHDRMSLQLFSQNLNAPLDPADIILVVVLIVVFAVIMIGAVVVTKRYVKKDLDQHKNQEALKQDVKKKIETFQDRHDVGMRQDELKQLSENIASHRRNLTFLWPLAQTCSIGVVVAAVYVLGIVSATAQDDTPIIWTIVGGMGALIVIMVFFNIPFFRFNKILNQGIPMPFRKYYLDGTPILTPMAYMAGFLAVSLGGTMAESTFLGQVMMVGMIIILFLVLIFAYWWLNPWKIIKQIETTIESQQKFPNLEDYLKSLLPDRLKNQL